jgi:hypothetical protein
MTNINKWFLALAASALLALSAHAESVEKKGVLVTKQCVAEGRFIECPLWTYDENADLVLFVHDDMRYYDLDLSEIKMRKIDKGFGRNGVEIAGTLDPENNLIVATSYKAPPPPAKSSFKG